MPRTSAPQVPLPLPDKPSIAVLPFQNMSGDPEQEYFADGICEDLFVHMEQEEQLYYSWLGTHLPCCRQEGARGT